MANWDDQDLSLARQQKLCDDTKFNGRVALVTGASRSIGAAIGRGLARDGARVIVNCNSSADEANQVVAAIAQEVGTATPLQANVSDPAQIKKLFNDAENAFGTVTLLVNNAGILRSLPAQQIDVAACEKTLGTNIRGLILWGEGTPFERVGITTN